MQRVTPVAHVAHGGPRVRRNRAKYAYHGFVIVAIAVAAYFQARGLSALLASELARGEPLPERPAAARGAVDAPAPQKSALPILARNPFDSKTGPLVRASEPDEVAAPSTAPLPDWAEAPPCSGGRVTVIAHSDDNGWSFATLEGLGGDERLARVGHDVGGWKVARIAWNRVWLETESARCQLELGAAPPSGQPAPPPAAAPPPGTMMPPGGPRVPGRVPPEIASKIQRTGETEFVIDRSAVDEIIARQAELLRSVRLVPRTQDGAVTGMALRGVQPGTLLDRLGLRNGDVIQSMNGFDLTNPETALQAYAKLRAADRLMLRIERNGQPVDLDYGIR